MTMQSKKAHLWLEQQHLLSWILKTTVVLALFVSFAVSKPSYLSSLVRSSIQDDQQVFYKRNDEEL